MLSEIWSIVFQQLAHTFKREEFLKNFINYILVEKSAYKGWKLYENDCEAKKNCITCYKKLIKHSHLPEDNPGIDIYIDEEFEYECGKWCLSGYFSDEIVMYRCEDCMSCYIDCENKDCKRWCNIESHCGYNYKYNISNKQESHLLKYIESKYHPMFTRPYLCWGNDIDTAYDRQENQELLDEWFDDPNSEKYFIIHEDAQNNNNVIFRKGKDMNEPSYSYEGMKFKCPSIKVWCLVMQKNKWHCEHCNLTFSYNI